MNLVQIRQREIQELLLVLPLLLTCSKASTLRWRRRRVRHLCDQVRSRSLRDAIDQDTQEWHAKKNVETNTESKEEAFPAAEPLALFLFGKAYTGEVWFEELAHQTARGKVGLEKDDEVSPGQEDACSEKDGCWTQPNSCIEGVETCRRENKTAYNRQVGQRVDGNGDESFTGEPVEEHGDSLSRASRGGAAITSCVLPQVWKIHFPQVLGVVVLVLLDIGGVDPPQGLHEAV